MKISECNACVLLQPLERLPALLSCETQISVYTFIYKVHLYVHTLYIKIRECNTCV